MKCYSENPFLTGYIHQSNHSARICKVHERHGSTRTVHVRQLSQLSDQLRSHEVDGKWSSHKSESLILNARDN